MSSIRSSFEIVNEKGLHARAATRFVKTAAKFDSTINVYRGDTAANGKSIMSLLILAAPRGSTLVVEADGSDAAHAVEALGELIRGGFGE